MARHTATNFSGGLQFPYADAATDIFLKGDIQTLALAVDQHTHAPGLGLPIAPTSIPNGSITSAMIVDGTIVSGDLANNAATLVSGAAGTGGASTTSASWTDMPDMAFTLSLVGGAPVMVWLIATLSHSTQAADCHIGISKDADAAANVEQWVSAPQANYGFHLSTCVVFSGLTAGSHTFKGRWFTGSGTLTAQGTLRLIMGVECRR